MDDHEDTAAPEPGRAPVPGRRRRRAAAAALVLAGAVSGAAVTAHVQPAGGSGAALAATGAVRPVAGRPAVPDVPAVVPAGTSATDAGAVATAVAPGVVDIDTTLGLRGAQAAGTGMVLTSTGEVLTNDHVISGATSISVTDVGNGRTYAATVVGYDRTADVAVLQLQGASGLRTVTTDTAAAQVGTPVVGVGNAGGAGGTPSWAAGEITAVGQTITASDSGDGTSEQLTGLLETDAAIVAGDSGGPLVDQQGRVLGMDTAAGSSSATGARAYAIPVASALQIAREIVAGTPSAAVHTGSTAMLGVGVAPTGASGSGSGAVLAQVVPGGPADSAGLAPGDTLVAVAGRSVSSADDLSAVVLGLRPGTAVPVRYVDASGVAHTVTVHLVAGPPQ